MLSVHYTGFHVFSYLTLRAILAVMSGLSLSLLVGPMMISRLSRYQIGQVVRDDGPRSHLPKAGTPTMGGALIIVAEHEDSIVVNRENGIGQFRKRQDERHHDAGLDVFQLDDVRHVGTHLRQQARIPVINLRAG